MEKTARGAWVGPWTPEALRPYSLLKPLVIWPLPWKPNHPWRCFSAFVLCSALVPVHLS